ncbi:hypothetical protein B0H15DRAFT_915280 [Mycena belliarum]|uniref:Ubiquitin 3 binding protein But2 C-terminal domain-containing protein n=1 Tax=Mycena belliarum TaxID=1033014 RepID=A0AAD6TU46_9AGAR|nr:hypothetical protein B0H15DRAFT_915280 [Mycena belliae]
MSPPPSQAPQAEPTRKTMSRPLAAGAIILCVISTIANIYIFNSFAKQPKILTFRNMVELRRPNQFIGLERVEMHPEARPILIYPSLLSQIDHAEPYRVYGDDPDKFAAWGGLVAPEDRQFKVTPQISTITEFQAIDFKMENCELTLIMPPNFHPPDTSRRDVLDIWILQVSHRLDIGTLSWHNRPKRIRKIDSVSMANPTNYTYKFGCPLNSLHAFEFSAGNHATYLEWSQDFNNPIPAVVMIQLPST